MNQMELKWCREWYKIYFKIFYFVSFKDLLAFLSCKRNSTYTLIKEEPIPKLTLNALIENIELLN